MYALGCLWCRGVPSVGVHLPLLSRPKGLRRLALGSVVIWVAPSGVLHVLSFAEFATFHICGVRHVGGIGQRVVSIRYERGKNGPQPRFCDSPSGFPTCFLPTHIPPSSENEPAHIPLERGGAQGLGRVVRRELGW